MSIFRSIFQLRKEAATGKEAQHLLREVGSVIDDMQQEVYHQIDAAKIHQTEEIMEGKRILIAIQLFRGLINKRVRDGKLAQTKIAEHEDKEARQNINIAR